MFGEIHAFILQAAGASMSRDPVHGGGTERLASWFDYSIAARMIFENQALARSMTGTAMVAPGSGMAEISRQPV